jgi:hypothetical protein
VRWLATIAVLCGGAAAAVAAIEGVTLPPEWTAEKIDVAGVEIHYSPDLRCRLATVSASASNVTAGAVWSAVREAAPEHGLSLEGGEQPASFERGEFLGAIRLRRLAGDTSAWQLQACFYRKRDQHVCKPICQKLLG